MANKKTRVTRKNYIKQPGFVINEKRHCFSAVKVLAEPFKINKKRLIIASSVVYVVIFWMYL